MDLLSLRQSQLPNCSLSYFLERLLDVVNEDIYEYGPEDHYPSDEDDSY